VERRAPKMAPEIATMALLVGYLLIKELLVFGPELRRDYYGSAVLNLAMCAVLFDEFRSRKHVAVQAALVFSAAIALISITVALGWGRQVGDDGRATFLGINENELALSFLVAFTFFAVLLNGDVALPRPVRAACYILSCSLIVALIGTGTRFALFMLLLQLCILLGYHLYNAVNGREGWLGTSMVVSWLAVVAIVTASSQTMMARLDPAMGAGRSDSSGLMELGGRWGLWVFAVDAFQRSPVWGLGRQGFEQFQLAEGQTVSLPHNLALEVAALGGMVGLAILGVLILQVLLRVLQGAISDRSDIVLMAIPLASAVLFLNIVPIKVVWFLLALFLARAMTRSIEIWPGLLTAETGLLRPPSEHSS
jgi:O-antigen ligase